MQRNYRYIRIDSFQTEETNGTDLHLIEDTGGDCKRYMEYIVISPKDK